MVQLFTPEIANKLDNLPNNFGELCKIYLPIFNKFLEGMKT